MQRIQKCFEIVIFTASLSIYAAPLLDQLDPTSISRHRLYREHCTLLNNTYVKDLSKLGRDLKDVIILDNSPSAYAFQPENAVPIDTWIDDMADNKLTLVAPLLEALASVPDVRPCLKRAIKGPNVDYLSALQAIQHQLSPPVAPLSQPVAGTIKVNMWMTPTNQSKAAINDKGRASPGLLPSSRPQPDRRPHSAQAKGISKPNAITNAKVPTQVRAKSKGPSQVEVKTQVHDRVQAVSKVQREAQIQARIPAPAKAEVQLQASNSSRGAYAHNRTLGLVNGLIDRSKPPLVGTKSLAPSTAVSPKKVQVSGRAHSQDKEPVAAGQNNVKNPINTDKVPMRSKAETPTPTLGATKMRSASKEPQGVADVPQTPTRPSTARTSTARQTPTATPMKGQEPRRKDKDKEPAAAKAPTTSEKIKLLYSNLLRTKQPKQAVPSLLSMSVHPSTHNSFEQSKKSGVPAPSGNLSKNTQTARVFGLFKKKLDFDSTLSSMSARSTVQTPKPTTGHIVLLRDTRATPRGCPNGTPELSAAHEISSSGQLKSSFKPIAKTTQPTPHPEVYFFLTPLATIRV